MPSTKKKVSTISGEEAGREILRDLCLLQRNKKENLDEREGRIAAEELSNMLYGLPTQADVKIYGEYRRLHAFFSQIPLILLALNRGCKLAVAQNHQELLMSRMYKNYQAEEPLLRYNVRLFRESLHTSSAYNILLKLAVNAFKVPELTYLTDTITIEHLDPYNDLARIMYPQNPPVIIFETYAPSKAIQARAVSALRSAKLPMMERVEKALARLVEPYENS